MFGVSFTAANMFAAGGNDIISVYDICNTCPNGAPPHTLCPNTLSFTYWVAPSGTPTTVTITGAGNVSVGTVTTPTVYNYSCVANYSCGSSQAKTGSVTVN